MMVRLSGRFSTFTVIGIQACKLTHSYTVLTGNFLALSAFFRSYSFASNGAFQNRGGAEMCWRIIWIIFLFHNGCFRPRLCKNSDFREFHGKMFSVFINASALSVR